MAEAGKRPTDQGSWEQRYVDGELPWDTGAPDGHLMAVMERHRIPASAAVEIGCGTGTNAVYLAQRGFEVTGLDLSKTAIERARHRAEGAGATCHFLVADMLQDPIPGGPFDFAYDRGCFHSFDDPQVRSRFAANVAAHLLPNGIWHSLIGSTDGPPRDTGPPRRSASEVIAAVEPHFEIVELMATVFDQGRHSDARAWVLVARRR